MENINITNALSGGIMIGLAATVLLLFAGRIAGISGIVKGVLKKTGGDKLWRWAFLAGLLAGGLLHRAMAENPVSAPLGVNPVLIIVAGLLVGFGTSMSNGCTSGHGVCGIARLSPRSLVATLTFMGSGMLTLYVARHILGVSP